MEILGFLFGFGCLVLIVWAIALLGGLVFGRKRRQQNRSQEPPSLAPPEIQERFGSPQSTIAASPTLAILRRRVVALGQPPVSTRVRQQ